MKKTYAAKDNSIKKYIIILAVFVLIGAGILLVLKFMPEKPAEEKSFTTEDFSITLTDSFKQEQYESFTYAFSSKNIVVLASKEEFSLFEDKEIMTEQEYAQLIIDTNKLEASVSKGENGIIYFMYEAKGDDVYTYFATTHKTDDSYWLIQFSGPKDKFVNYEEQVKQWAASISFNK